MKIGELAKIAHCTTETIRFYEKEGLLPEAERTEANYRSYTARHVERLRFIRNCRALDMTHDEIRALLRLTDAPASGCRGVNDLIDEHIAHVEVRLDELQQLKAQLHALREQCHGEQAVEECGIVQGLSDMDVSAPRARHTHLGWRGQSNHIVESSWRSNVFTCRNQSCGAQWEQSDVVIKNEGQGLLFRCPLCGARNYVERFEDDNGAVLYEQVEGRPSPGPMAE